MPAEAAMPAAETARKPSEPARAEASRPQPSRGAPSRPEPSRPEPSRAEPSRSDRSSQRSRGQRDDRRDRDREDAKENRVVFAETPYVPAFLLRPLAPRRTTKTPEAVD